MFDHISPTYQDGGFSICVFADIHKAFDTLDHSRLLSKLYAYGIRGVAHKLFQSFLTNRKQYVQIGHSGVRSETIDCTIGTAQGSVLGPLLFSLYMNDLSDVMNECDVVMFADDVVFHMHSNSLIDVEKRMNLAMDKFNDYCTYNYLTVSNKKTKHMTFSNKTISNYPVIKNRNEILENVATFKYLGIIIDQNLRHFSHLKLLITYMKQQVGILNCNGKYFNLKASLNYYYAYIYSKLNYGINAWGGVLLAHSASNELKNLHNKVVKLLFARFFNLKTAEQVFSRLKILKLEDIYRYNLMITMFNIAKRDRIPFMYRKISSFGFKHVYNTRNNILRLPICYNSFFTYNFVYRAIKVFNDIPNKLKNIANFNSFKNCLKKYFVDKY